MFSDLMPNRGGIPNEGPDALASFKVAEALRLMAEAVEEHGGTLMLCEGSEHTCFRLLLPLQPDSEN
jgi:hypothetical protein